MKRPPPSRHQPLPQDPGMNYVFPDLFKDEDLSEDTQEYLFADYDPLDAEEIKARQLFLEQGKKFDFTLVGVDVYDGVEEDSIIVEKYEKTLKMGAIDSEFSRLFKHRVYVTVIRRSGKIIGFDESAIPED
jgi:hypothetical protein